MYTLIRERLHLVEENSGTERFLAQRFFLFAISVCLYWLNLENIPLLCILPMPGMQKNRTDLLVLGLLQVFQPGLLHTRVILNYYIFLQEKRPFLARLFLLGINVLFPIQASITDLQVECSEAQLEIITGNLQRKWNDIAKLLGLDKNVISKIEEGGKNPFAEIISNWKKKKNDSSFTYDTLITEFCKSSEFTGKKEYVEQTILSLIPCKLYSTIFI